MEGITRPLQCCIYKNPAKYNFDQKVGVAPNLKFSFGGVSRWTNWAVDAW